MKRLSPTLTTLFLTLGAAASAQPGSLDNSFSSDGKVTTAFGSGLDFGFSVAVQLDGRIVVAGNTDNGSDRDFALARYNMDGTVDNSFSGDGKVTTAFGSGNDIGLAVAIQPDGRIVMAGFAYVGSGRDFVLARYNTDGTLDNSFSADGKVTTDFGTGDAGDDDGWSVAIQQDGRIVVAGYSNIGTSVDFALARYNTDGTLDNSFSADGKVTTDFGTGDDSGASVAIQLDGKIVVAGSSSGDFALARYNTDGTLDNSFSGDGKVTTDFGTGSSNGRSVAIQPDGKIVVAGRAYVGTDSDLAIARYSTDGTLDNSFSGDGKVSTDFGTVAAAGNSVTIQSNGKIIVAGSASNGTDSDFVLARYNTDGTPDNGFGVNGKVTTAFGTDSDSGESVAIAPDGKIVVAGSTYNGIASDFALARYISGLNVGIVDLSLANSAPLIYPNPINHHATLEYTLQNAEVISIQLLDMQGRTVQTFIAGQVQAAGAHRLTIDLPEALTSGQYLIAISSPNGKFMVQVVK